MQDLRYPLTFTFKIGTLANDFTATDATGRVVAYVRQKMLRLKEDIEIFGDERRSRVLYNIRADRWLDWSAAYAFYDARGTSFGKVARKGWRSLWKAEYEIVDHHDQPRYTIREENGWVKVIDSLVGEVPVLGLLTGYLFHPSYLVTDHRGREVARLSKQPSFFGRKFRVDKLAPVEEVDDDRIMLGLMMMILLERRRG
ncbi:hypothetical protein GGR26_002762 [Lewinella marina]|uniref:Phospholipid scramblase n=1 Tax=Neolewinella marina TaxID=438751 RepID=A0A2G0CD11_9BACT|nr:hypothetical protein [Neolewinella marina]NJB86985.1 hypothetical protein [Neolewinella marina]PHK97820.1 hypothetical protein CGL56_13475 [Neolewinella marina]